MRIRRRPPPGVPLAASCDPIPGLPVWWRRATGREDRPGPLDGRDGSPDRLGLVDGSLVEEPSDILAEREKFASERLMFLFRASSVLRAMRKERRPRPWRPPRRVAPR